MAVQQTITKKMQVLQLWEAKLEDTDIRITKLLDIFDETGLSQTRNGKKH